MKLVETKCPNCGSSIEVEKRKKNIKCEYCGTSFAVSDDVIEVKHLMAGEISEEQEFINAETNLNKLKNYDEAYDIYLSLSKRYVDNAEIWIGLLRSLTKDFTYKYGSQDFKKLYQKYWSSFIALADEDEREKYEKKYKDYVDKVSVSSSNDGKIVKQEKCYLAVTVLGGMFGIHKFLQGKTILGFVYMFTFGLYGIGWIYDIIQEYKKWSETSQKGVVKWCIFAFFMIFAIMEIKYSFLAFICYLFAAISSLDYPWSKVNVKKTAIRIIVPLAFFLIAISLGSTTVPESSYGTWNSEIETDFPVIEISDSEIKLYYDSDKKDHVKSINSTYYKSKVYLEIDEETTLVFSYSTSKRELCLLNEKEKCTVMYKLVPKENKDK